MTKHAELMLSVARAIKAPITEAMIDDLVAVMVPWFWPNPDPANAVYLAAVRRGAKRILEAGYRI
jgi:hypothetical protein